MFIANIAFEKTGIVPEFKSFGCIWYDKEKHHASILLRGFRFGQFFGMPFKNVSDAPYLEGDIVVWTGEFINDSALKEYLWCGWVWTCSDQRGVVYNGVLEISPLPVLLQRELKETNKDIRGNKQGVWMNISLIDKNERKKI